VSSFFAMMSPRETRLTIELLVGRRKESRVFLPFFPAKPASRPDVTYNISNICEAQSGGIGYEMTVVFLDHQ
jgi:hypothetical protein